MLWQSAVLLLLAATKTTAYWCNDFPPLRTKDFGYLQLAESTQDVPLWNESRRLWGNETMTPTCGRADFFNAQADVKPLKLNHLGPTVWTMIDADHARYLRAVDVNITNLNGVVRAYAVQAWYHDKQASGEVFSGTWDLTVAEAKHAYDTKAGTITIKTAPGANGYGILKLTFSIQAQNSGYSGYACDVQGRNLTNITAGCEGIIDPSACKHSYTSHKGVPIPCTLTSHGGGENCAALTACAGDNLVPKTIGWNGRTLLDMQLLLSTANAPQVCIVIHSVTSVCCRATVSRKQYEGFATHVFMSRWQGMWLAWCT